MNAFVKKEIRLLLPCFLIGCALALPNLAFRFQSDGSLMSWWWFVLAFVFSGAMAVMLALNSFGAEVSSATFSNLLAQPISRQKIWDTKIALLATALFVVGACWSGCGIARLMMLGRELNLLDLFSGVITFGLVVFSGALWTVLLLRQVAAAFWFTLLVPGVILVILAAFFADQSPEFFTGLTVSVLGLYSLAGFFFARWLFFRAQDVQWSGGTIVMPEMRGLARFKSVASVRSWRPRAALWRKEFMLHQSQFVMAFVLLVLHLGVLGVRHFCDLSHSRDLKFTLEIFWGLWFVMPLLVGCAAVAEERKIGTLEGQLCLPVKRRTQFAIKFFVALFLSLLLGVAMPLLLEGTRILPGVPFGSATLQKGLTNALTSAQFDFWVAIGILNGYLPLLAFIGIALLIGGVAFYASSLARNTLQSLAPAVLGTLLMVFLLFAAAMPWGRELEFLWRGPLAYFIGVPLVLLTLVALAYWNFQQVKASAQMGWRNVLAFVLAVLLGVTTTVAVYHRAWEKLTPFEPVHDAARFSLADSVRLENDWRNLTVRLPEGKFWQARFKYTAPNPLAILLGNFKAPTAEGAFLSGSNWTATVDGFWFQQAGIKTDGTLWVSPKPAKPSKLDRTERVQSKVEPLARFGSETNWSSLLGQGLSVFLVKNDGTLWRWGVTNFDLKHKTWPGLQAFTPYRLGTETNWAEVFQSSYRLKFRKTDDSVWTLADNWNTNNRTLLEIEPGLTVASLKDIGPGKFRSTASIQHGLQYQVGVRDDGTLRIWADERWDRSKKTHNNYYEWFPTDLQIGNETNWLAVGGNGEKIITLKKDGTLWLWNFHRSSISVWDQNQFEAEIQKTIPVRLGRHTDWVAISGYWGTAITLAADGSLWWWPLQNAEQYYNDLSDSSGIGPLLDISQKPQLIGNVFSRSD